MMTFAPKEAVAKLREKYPHGTRVELVHLGDDPYSLLLPGDCGTVDHVDSTGTIHINWDTGSRLGMVYGVDEVKIIG